MSVSHIEEQLGDKYSKNTSYLYLNVYKKLKNKLSPTSKTYYFLYDVERVMDYLSEHYSLKSKRTLLGYIVGLLKSLKNDTKRKKKHMEAILQYKKLLKDTIVKKEKVKEEVKEEVTEEVSEEVLE